MLFVKLISLVTVLRVAISVYLGRKNKGNISPYDHIVYENATPVDIVVPMYNESDVILKTLKSLSVINYSNFRVIVIDDGSTDDSLQLVERNFGQYDNFVILSQTNLGKAEALNNAISASTGEIIICIDADTLVKPNIINSFLPYFDNKDVAAVAGYVKVGNRINLITKIQNIEYVTNQNYVRSIFDSVNGILVVPGAVGAFRTSIIKQVGGYSSGTLTEDSDLTFRIIKRGFVIKNSLDAIGFTEAPATLKMFCRQRVRWIVGNLQVLTKYRNSFFLMRINFLGTLSFHILGSLI
ncbi:glycosyltransferase family 2 protein [Mucilaginibacter sp. P25]|uniref:glycosyltransferase family 2 protein n=1 Tax=Mucilaginibacter sp. P25 TaxID=3423945 RepID=UPI003D79B26E